MSCYITPAELTGLTEQQLRAKRVAILNDLAARGVKLEDCPYTQMSLRFIDEALLHVKRCFPKPPGF